MIRIAFYFYSPFFSILVGSFAFSAHADEDPLAAVEAYQQRMFENIAPAVAFIRNKDTFGSGFFVSPTGLVLTNYHVVKGSRVVQVILHNGRKLKGTVVERAKDKVDLALVQVSIRPPKFLDVGSDAGLRVGSWVASIGHGSGGIWTFNTGMVSNIYPSGAKRQLFQTQIPLNPGSSGGPLLDRKGQVIGIVVAGLTESNSINFGIKSSLAIQKLSKLAKYCNCLTILAPPNVPIFVDGVMVGTGPRMVVPAVKKSYTIFAVINGKMVKHKINFPSIRKVNLFTQ